VIKKQLKRIQSSPHFSHSRRYPNFLNFVVHKALEGRQVDLKERTIGIEAFGRPPDYDLNDNPIVRVTAGEGRKRLAQYYYEAVPRQNSICVQMGRILELGGCSEADDPHGRWLLGRGGPGQGGGHCSPD